MLLLNRLIAASPLEQSVAESTQARPRPKPSMMRRAVMAAGALGLIALGAWALWPKPALVDIATVVRGPMSVTVEEEGKTRIKDVFVVSAPVAGTMRRTPLLAGDAVERDRTIVAAIQPAAPPFLDFRTRAEAAAHVKAAEAAVLLAEAELAQARSELTFAESELARAAALLKTNVIAARAHEKAVIDLAVRKAAVAKADANVAVRRRELDSARARLLGPDDDKAAGVLDADCCLEVRSPESGRVLRVLVTSEQIVTNGMPLIEIGNPRSLEIVVDLLSSDAVKVREGALAEVDGWGGGRKLSARVRRIETAGFTKVSALGIEEQRVRVVLDLLPDTEGRDHGLGHEFRVFVRIREWEAPDALTVPIGALFRHDGRWAVFRLDAGRAYLAPLEIAHRNAEVAEVLSGLEPGYRVILHPSDRVAAGVRVRPRSLEAGSTSGR